MTAPKLLTSDTMIADRNILRHDWEGSPRFYFVRLYEHDPRECPSHPHLYTPRVRITVELEGDPMTSIERTPDDDADEITEAVFECIHEIEDMRAGQWEAEQERHQREMQADYWRSRL